MSGCVLTNPEFKSAQGRFQYTSPPNHVVGNNELNKAIEYALKTQEDFDDWQGELTSLNNIEIWSLFTLGTASGTAAAYGAPKDVIVGLGIGVAALLGAGEIANLDKRSLIIVNGHKAIQCSIDTALEINAVSNKLRSAKSTFPQLAFKPLRPTLTMGFVGKSANSILASSQGATLAEIQSVASFFGVKNLSERANRKLSDAQQNLTTAMTNAETKAMVAASALDKTVTAIRYTVRRQVRKNKIDKGQILKINAISFRNGPRRLLLSLKLRKRKLMKPRWLPVM